MRINFVFILVLSLIFSGCSKPDKDNQKPFINISHVAEGLQVTLTGSIADNDGTIVNLCIKWGDNDYSQFYSGDFSSLSQTHTYAEPASYNIRIDAIDNTGDSTTLVIPITVNFKETLLTGIKQSMMKTNANEFLILTLNLHTYQETQQSEKLNIITDVIGKMDIDFIAFQECAQNKSSAFSQGIVRVDNMALIISNSLKAKYNADYSFAWNWSHYGWNVWEVGVAVLSKHQLLVFDSRYVSSGTTINNITSRKVIYGSYQTAVGRINLFSAHTHWRLTLTDEEQNNQIKNIKSMVVEMESTTPLVSFVCGDFNGNPTSDYPWSEGYNTMMINHDYVDSFLAIYLNANSRPAQSIYYTVGGDLPGRIDYIFMKNSIHFTVVDSQIIFKTDDVGRVSDHYGVLTKVTYSN
jgi:maltose 6'-phosphate phosphatase